MSGDQSQLNVILTINDKLSKGLHPPTIALRKFAKEGGQALAVISALQRMMARSTTNSAIAQQRKEIAALRKEASQAATQIEKIRRGGRREGSGSNRPRGNRNQSGISEDLADDFILGGAGYGLLRGFRSGTNAAGDYEAAILTLRNAFSEYNQETGKVDGKLNRQLEEAGNQAKALGNDLMGNSQTYAEIFSALRKSGIQTEDILNGAGRAASYLANVSGAISEGRGSEQAKELGQFFLMFKLQSKDFEKSVNLFSSLKDKFDIDSSEIIESSKYFQGMANTLKLKEFEGSATTAKFFAFLKRYGGLEGSQAGTTASSMFEMFATHGKAVQALKKKHGIDLNIFDKKGEFLGFENAFKEMEKLRKLAPKQRIETLQDIFGTEGGKAVNQMTEQGVEGWRNITIESNKAIPVAQKITEQMATYNSKVEAVQGSWENLKATMFTPAMDTLKPVLDSMNSILGKLQEFSKAHTTISKTITLIMGVGGAVLTVVAAIGALKTGMRVFQTFNRFSAVVDELSAIKRGADGAAASVSVVGTEATKSTKKLSGMRGALSSVSGTFKTALLITTVGYTIEQILELIQDLKDFAREDAAEKKAHSQSVESLKRLEEKSKQAGVPVDSKIYQQGASAALASLNREGTLKQSLEGVSFFRELLQNPFAPDGYPFSSGKFEEKRVQTLKERAPELVNSNVMYEFLKKASQMNLSPEANTYFRDMLSKAFPESFKTATQQLAADQIKLSESTTQTSDAIMNLKNPMDALLFGVQNVNTANNNLANATNEVANKIRNVSIQPSVTNPLPSLSPSPIPKSAVGSIVQRDGLVFAHRGNVITPASLSRRAPGDWLDKFALGDRLSGSGSRNVSVTINVPPGSQAANDVDALARLVKQEVEKVINNPPAMDGDNLARMVNYSASRREDRT